MENTFGIARANKTSPVSRGAVALIGVIQMFAADAAHGLRRNLLDPGRQLLLQNLLQKPWSPVGV
jgi:hypothetical protein